MIYSETEALQKMIDEKYIDIIDKAAIGTATSSELDQLKKYLEVNEEAREYYNKVIRLSGVLDLADNVSPPPDLKNNIMAKIQSNRYVNTYQGKIFKNYFAYVRSIFKRKYVIAFSIGAVFGIILLLLLTNPGNIDFYVNDSDAIGSMLLKNISDDSHVIDTYSVNTRNVNGLIETIRRNDIIILNLDLVSENNVVLTIIFDENDLEYMGFIQQEISNKDLEIRPGKIIISYEGIAKDRIFLKDKVGLNSHTSIGIQPDSEGDSIKINLRTWIE